MPKSKPPHTPSDWKVRHTRSAEADIDAILDFIAEREQVRRHKLSAMVAQCDKDAPPPADMAAWDAAPPTGKEIL